MIIPCLNEAHRLPLLLADLKRWPGALETVVVDGGSTDQSAIVSQLAGARCVQALQRGRGHQLSTGAHHAQGDWLLFLHADSRLGSTWTTAVHAVLGHPGAERSAWYFDLRLEPKRPSLTLLETCVALRSRWLQRPYGDQGLLLQRQLYQRCGGYAPIPLMEDLDLVLRLAPLAPLRPLGESLVSDGRRWSDTGVLERSWRNAQLRHRWRRGESPEQLATAYYGSQSREGAQEAYQKPQRWP